MTRTSETIPVTGGRLALGTWQGLFLFEHRAAGHRRTLVVLFVVLGVVGAAVFLCVFGCVYAAFGKYLQAREAPFRSGAAPAPAASLMHKKRRAPSSSPRPTTPLAEDDDDSIDIELSPRYV